MPDLDELERGVDEALSELVELPRPAGGARRRAR